MGNEFKNYSRTGLSEMRAYVPGEDLSEVSISKEDIPCLGGMIAKNPLNPADRWYVSEQYFKENFKIALEPHQQRVIDERTELIDKITKLHNFFKTEIFGNLDDKDQDLLDQQVQKMMNYADILFKRINKF